MIRFDVFITAEAEEDIAGIHDYLEGHESTDTADRVAAALFEMIGTLGEMPRRGNMPKELSRLSAAGCRELHYQNYRIFYRIEDRGVFAFAVADGRRDMRSFLLRRLVR